VVGIVWLLSFGAGVASAHAFLVGSDPPQGARLAHAPSSITLSFSEDVVTSATTVSIHLAGSDRRVPATVEPGGDASSVSVRLGAAPKGIYVVNWQDLSAEDGHQALGEFAFAVGPVSGALPAPAQRGSAPNPLRVAATVLFLFGLALAGGGAVTGLVVDRSVTTTSVPIRAGLLASVVGATVAFLDEVGGGTTGLSHAALLSAIAALLAAAAMLAVLARRLGPVLVMLVGAGVAWAADGHPALVGGAVGLVVNALHLVVGALWAGSLAFMVAAALRYRAERAQLMEVARRYARLALPLVVVLGAAGGLSALETLPSWSSLYDSGYGQLLLVKTGLFALALALAWAGRSRGIARSEVGLLRRALPVEAGVVAVILVVTAVLADTGPPAKTQPARAQALLGPAPLTGPVARAAGLAGELTVAVAAGSGQFQVQVYDPNGPAPGARVGIDATYPDGKDVGLFPRACGTGCFTQTVTLPAGRTRLHLEVAAPGWPGGTWNAGIDWPPPPTEPLLLGQVVAAMEKVPAVATRETVTSDTAGRSFTSALAPLSGAKLMSLEPYSGDAEQPGLIPDVQPLSGGRRGLQVYLPGTPAWITLWLNPEGRLARDRVVDLGHLITDTFSYPSTPAPAAPGPSAPGPTAAGSP
jgi:copper transport protein